MVFASMLFAFAALSFGYRLSRSTAFLWFGAFFAFSYFADLLVTRERGALYFSRSFSTMYVAPEVFELVAVYAAAALTCYVAFFLILSRLPWFARKPVFPEGRALVGWRYLILICTPLLVVPAALGDVLGSYDLAFLLSNRQIVYAESFAAHLLLYLAPPSCVLAFVGIAITRSWVKRCLLGAIGMFLLVLSALSGSRSTLFLSILLPLFFFFVMPRLWAARSGVGRHLGAIVLVAALGLVAAVSASYLDYARGDQDSESFLVAPDFGMLDATALIIDNELSGFPSYFSALTFAIPRSIWPDKPVSGNHVFSEQLFGERLEATRTEMTASLLGEAYINLGWWGVVSAGFLMAAVAAASRKYLNCGGLYFALGLVLAFRGLNIVRGDLHNTVVPLAFSVLWVQIALSGRQLRGMRKAPSQFAITGMENGKT